MSDIGSDDSRTMDGFQTPPCTTTAGGTTTVGGTMMTPSGVSATSGGDFGDRHSQPTSRWIKNNEWTESPHGRAPILRDSRKIPTLMKGLVLATLPYTNKSFHEATDGYFNIDVSRGATVFRPPTYLENDDLATIALEEISRYLADLKEGEGGRNAVSQIERCQRALEPLKQSRAEWQKTLDAAKESAGSGNQGTQNLINSAKHMSGFVQEALRPYVKDKTSQMEQTDAQVAEDPYHLGQMTVFCHMPSRASSVWNTVRALLDLEEGTDMIQCPSIRAINGMNDISAGLVDLAGHDSRFDEDDFEDYRKTLLWRFPRDSEDQMSEKWNSIKDAGRSILEMYLQRVDDTDKLSKGIIGGLTAMGGLLVHGLPGAEDPDSDHSGSIDVDFGAMSDTGSDFGSE